MKIENISIGSGAPAFLIAEVGQAHDGSLGIAHAYIDAASEVGVDAVKFQTHLAAAESTLDEPFRIRFSRQDETRYAYWKRMEFSFEQWQELKDHALEKGLVFLSSPFSVQAVELLTRLDIPAWKIGSGETVSGDILDVIIETKKPVLVSTGMSTFEEIECMVKKFRKSETSFALLQCTSKYPVDFSEVGLNVLQEMKELFHCPVGLSDHSGSIFPPLAALALGVDLIETHIVFDKRMFGPDATASLTMAEFTLLVKARTAFHRMKSNPVDKNKMVHSLSEMRNIFGKSLATTKDLPAGTVLTEALLTCKKPGTGIPIGEKEKIIGRKLKNAVFRTRLLRWEDLDG